MPDQARIEQVVRKAVSEALAGSLQRLETELVARVLREVEPHFGGESAGAASSTADSGHLLKAVAAVQSGSTQREILRTLLDGAAHYSGRVALFVVKGGAATGWQGRGFANADEIKDFALEIGSGLAAQAMQSRSPAPGRVDQMDGKFTAQFHAPADGAVLVLPLLLKEKVAALVYADRGVDAGGKMDASALELLVLTSSAWLEVASLRKHAPKTAAESTNHDEENHPPAPAPAPSFSDPFAAHAPAHSNATPAVMEAPMVAPPAAATATMSTPSENAAAAKTQSGSAAAVALAPDPHASLSPEDAEVHRKAQRFARLLVDEIKLYNQAKVTEGRKSRDLYDRLKEDIDKSRATYEKRYGQTVAASTGYFNQELVRSLAEDDISLMGANFQR